MQDKVLIIFCRFIATAHYVAEQLKHHLGKTKDIEDQEQLQVSLANDERRRKIVEMHKSS